MESSPHEGISPPGCGLSAAGDGAAVCTSGTTGSRTRTAGGSGRQMRVWQGWLWMLFLVQAALVCCHTWLPLVGFHQDQLLKTGLLLLAVGVTYSWLAQTLPAQNVVLAGTVAMLVSAAAMVVMAAAGVPLSRHTAGRTLGMVEWLAPVSWMVVALNSRGVARGLLSGFRGHHYYGFLLVALSACLSGPLFWLWGSAFGLLALPLPSGSTGFFKSLPVEVAELALVSLLISVFTTPALINKRPGAQHPPAVQPLLISSILTLVAFWS